MDQATDSLARWRHNIHMVSQLIQNDVSSTKVRVPIPTPSCDRAYARSCTPISAIARGHTYMANYSHPIYLPPSATYPTLLPSFPPLNHSPSPPPSLFPFPSHHLHHTHTHSHPPSQVRLFLKRGLSVHYLLPAPVVDYIEEHHLYQDDTSERRKSDSFSGSSSGKPQPPTPTADGPCAQA